MTPKELLNHTRLKVVSMGIPLPLDATLFSYINNAYVAFVNEMGGVIDELEIDIEAGDVEVEIPDYVLKIKSVQKADGSFVTVVNRADVRDSALGSKLGVPGELTHLVIGSASGKARLAGSPTEALTITLDVERLPKKALSQTDSTVPDVEALWQIDVADGAIGQVLLMSDNPAVRKQGYEYEARMKQSAQAARKKKERSKSKQTRVIRYGGY